MAKDVVQMAYCFDWTKIRSVWLPRDHTLSFAPSTRQPKRSWHTPWSALHVTRMDTFIDSDNTLDTGLLCLFFTFTLSCHQHRHCCIRFSIVLKAISPKWVVLNHCTRLVAHIPSPKTTIQCSLSLVINVTCLVAAKVPISMYVLSTNDSAWYDILHDLYRCGTYRISRSLLHFKVIGEVC